MSCINARLCSADSAAVNSHPVGAVTAPVPMRWPLGAGGSPCPSAKVVLVPRALLIGGTGMIGQAVAPASWQRAGRST